MNERLQVYEFTHKGVFVWGVIDNDTRKPLEWCATMKKSKKRLPTHLTWVGGHLQD